MAKVEFTNHLKRFFPTLGPQTLPASTVAELVRALDGRFPGIAGYLVDERGSLRKHVNIFVDGELVVDRARLGDALGDTSEVFIAQALSGG
jgi:molybdopterin synthase sulfur carrier subunit